MTAPRPPTISRQVYAWVKVPLVGLLLIFSSCRNNLISAHWTELQASMLRERLEQMDSTVDSQEAARLAKTAAQATADLAYEYRPMRPAWFNNVLVNAGWRDRGLCYEWANDLFPHLNDLHLQTLDVHFAVASMDTKHEHNGLVITAKGHPFHEGLILDAWRHSGYLWFGKVEADKFPWEPLPRERIPKDLRNLMP